MCKQTQPPAPACKMFDVNRWCLSTPFNIEVDGLVIMIDPSSPFRARKAGETYLGERRHFDISTFRQIVSRVGTKVIGYVSRAYRTSTDTVSFSVISPAARKKGDTKLLLKILIMT